MKLNPSSIFEEWRRNENYMASMGFNTAWPNYVNFKEGIQWPKQAMAKWKNFTFITVNQCDFIIENKKSNILSQNLKVVFTPKEVPENGTDEQNEELTSKAQDYTNLAQNTFDDIDQSELDDDVVDDALTIGSGFYHYYADTSYTGGQFQPTKGRICGHSVDALDVALGDPHLKPHQLQKQPFIIIKTFEDVDKLKEHAKKNGENHLLIVPNKDNDEMYDNAKQDIENANKCVALTKYYKENGEVWWIKVTETATVQKARKLSPTDTPFRVYPVEHLVFKPRKKCAYGRSILEDTISIQKGINFLYSMISYGVQQTAWPKIIAKAGALMQQINNEPGEIVTDHDKTGAGEPIKYMQPPNFSNMPPLLIDKLTEVMRQTTNTGDVISGESIGANMAAAAIIALQNQAKKPNERYVNKLKQSKKRIGRIMEEFFKCYYILPRSVVSEDMKGKKTSKVITPSDYVGMEFETTIDVGAGGAFDEALQVSQLDKYAERQWIDKYQYTKYAPNNMLPQGMKEDFEEEKERLEEQERAMAEQQQMLAEQQSQADDIIGQLTPDEQQALAQDPSLLQQPAQQPDIDYDQIVSRLQV